MRAPSDGFIFGAVAKYQSTVLDVNILWIGIIIYVIAALAADRYRVITNVDNLNAYSRRRNGGKQWKRNCLVTITGINIHSVVSVGISENSVCRYC